MKVFKYLRASHSSASQDVTNVAHKTKSRTDSSGRKAQSAPSSPTPARKHAKEDHPEDIKTSTHTTSSSFFSRSFRRNKSFTRMRNFFENIANIRSESKAVSDEEENKDKVTLRKRRSTSNEKPEIEDKTNRVSVHDDRICEVLQSILTGQQSVFGKS